jgi:prolyl 4-hydroxylase
MASNGVGSLTLLALLGIVVGLLTSFTVAISSTHSIQSSVDSSSHEDGCYSHSYSTFILSKDPLVIYINSFITLDEAAHMLNLR